MEVKIARQKLKLYVNEAVRDTKKCGDEIDFENVLHNVSMNRYVPQCQYGELYDLISEKLERIKNEQ